MVPDDQDGKTEDCVALQRDSPVPETSTRQGGKKNEVTKRRLVIVDIREFRSELPTLIHKRGIDIEPVTISVNLSTIVSDFSFLM